MFNCLDIVGERFGRLVVESFSHKEVKEGKVGFIYYYNCKCDCGNPNIIKVSRSGLMINKRQSCGCLKSEITAKRNHDTAKYNGESSTEYDRILRIYGAMKNRCYSKRNQKYKDYGGRGIIICDEWLNDYFTFKKWALENGYKGNLSIDRIDVNGNYEPSNCKWSTMEEQANNTRKNKYITYQGRTQTLSKWCKELGLEYDRIKARFNTCHMTPEQAFELPKQILRRKVAEE
mgnify:CR=1 FL=1